MANENQWTVLRRWVQENHPFCRLKDVRVSGGVIVSYGRVQYTRALGKASGPGPLPAALDAHWSDLTRLCSAMREGTIAEISFTDARPVLVSLEAEGGVLTPA